ncbi:hypothetical protein FRB90_006809 [Tulasnella sp. 427]|nr:hypothetical protein FRB90_006809 [Tulasnella sp. 427]
MVTTRGRTFNGQSDLAHEPGYERQHGAKKKSRVQKADTTGDNVRGSIPNRIKARGQLLELTSNSLVPEERSAMMSMPIEIFAEVGATDEY